VQGIAVAVAITVASLWIIYPHIHAAWKQTQAGTQMFLRRDGMHWVPGQAGFDHTLFSFIKTVLPTTNPWVFAKVFVVYVLVVAVAVIWAWFSKVQQRPLLERLTFLTVLIVLLPATSYDYTLVHLYAPWALLVVAIARGDRLTTAGRFALGCFAILLTAQGYIIVDGHHLSAELKCLALLGLGIISVFGNDQVVQDSVAA
jgi:hypothetical protein